VSRTRDETNVKVGEALLYTKGSQECLQNADRLLNDAKTLLSRGSFGTAQSLGVTAMEEVGKAIILGLSDLDLVGKEIVEDAMKKHLIRK